MDSESKSVAVAEDRISALPDAVLSRIISCIDPKLTKCAVRTSILSKRWKNMWASVPNLYFDDNDFSSAADFIAFVDHALQIRDSLAIRKFGIAFSRFEHCDEALSHIDDWISTAARCHVVVLALRVDTDGDKIFDLPKSLFSCKTLTALKLGVNFIINIPTSECFPRLKSLHLTFYKPRVVCPAYDSIDFSYFRVLEHLTILGSFGYGGFNFNISLSELKTLRINLFAGHGRDAVYSFLINAPKLETLDVSEGLLSDYTFENTNSLVEANIKVIYDTYEQAVSANLTTKLLAGISGVKCLYTYLQSPLLKVSLHYN